MQHDLKTVQGDIARKAAEISKLAPQLAESENLNRGLEEELSDAQLRQGSVDPAVQNISPYLTFLPPNFAVSPSSLALSAFALALALSLALYLALSLSPLPFANI